jgi:hypothetical protein
VGQPRPEVCQPHVRQVADPAITGKCHQVPQVTQVGPLGVRGLTPLGTKLSDKGQHVVDGVWGHPPTLTKPGAIGKDIGGPD